MNYLNAKNTFQWNNHSAQDSNETVGEKNRYLMGSHISAECSLSWQLSSVLPGVLPPVCDQTIKQQN
jgi:hypothetical protein